METCRHCGNRFAFVCECRLGIMSEMLKPEALENSRSYTQKLIERLEAIENQPNFLKLWKGRPKTKCMNIPWYQFGTRTCQGVPASPARYIPVDWRGLV